MANHGKTKGIWMRSMIDCCVAKAAVKDWNNISVDSIILTQKCLVIVSTVGLSL